MTANKHADLMMQYAKNAAETERPYERWEVCQHPGLSQWLNLNKHPSWENDMEYRRKPKPFTVRINGGAEIHFGTALRSVPMANEIIHIVCFSQREAAFIVESEQWDTKLAPYLKGGLCFDTLEWAEAMRDVLNKIVSTT